MNNKTLKAKAKAHAKEQLGAEQFAANKGAAQAIAEDFEAGGRATAEALLQGLLEQLRQGNELTHKQLDAAAKGLGMKLD